MYIQVYNRFIVAHILWLGESGSMTAKITRKGKLTLKTIKISFIGCLPATGTNHTNC